jgi:hypothetical protein
LLISIVFFCAYLASEPTTYSPILRYSAWLSLLGFLTLTLFLAFALKWTEQTIRVAVSITMLKRLAPALAARLADKVRALILGFRVLRDPGNLLPFLGQSALYWGTNGVGMWILAKQMNLDISLTAAFAAMSFTGVVISLPNAPGLVGQFHAGVIESLSAYVPAATLASHGGAYAIAVHGIQFVWYVVVGVACLFLVGGRSLRSVVLASNDAAAHDGTVAR